jgi:aminoglycoside phosphotransferase family enzyme/predicted kinase
MPDCSTPPLIAALLRPALHGTADTQLIETHISWVILAGDFAYKLKKPVNFGFLDFSTPEKRCFYCEEELRLNRRLAPEIYLDVITINGTPEDAVFGGEGPVIEYAVKMRRFPQEQLLSNLLSQGKLEMRHIDALAAEIAHFHSTIPVADSSSPFGTRLAVLDPALENFLQIRPFLNNAEDVARLDALREWTSQEFTTHMADFSIRKSGGFIRECHGDMHTGNMVLLDDTITIFDCIEFNPNLRWIDVMSETAFVVMDLMERGYSNFAWRFLNAYLSLTGDHNGIGVLRFYLVYRAMVRAKVAAIRAGQSHADEAWQEYANYVTLAETLSQRVPPVLIITHGLSGSGKTTLTQLLLEELGAIRLRSDVERKRLFGLVAQGKSGSGIDTGLYTRDAGGRTYARLLELARIILAAGFTVIVDAAFLRRIERDIFHAIATELQIPFAILDAQAPEVTLRARISQREIAGQDASEATIQVLERQLATQELLAAEEIPYTMAIDAEDKQPNAGDIKALLTAWEERSA